MIPRHGGLQIPFKKSFVLICKLCRNLAQLNCGFYSVFHLFVQILQSTKNYNIRKNKLNFILLNRETHWLNSFRSWIMDHGWMYALFLIQNMDHVATFWQFNRADYQVTKSFYYIQVWRNHNVVGFTLIIENSSALWDLEISGVEEKYAAGDLCSMLIFLQ